MTNFDRLVNRVAVEADVSPDLARFAAALVGFMDFAMQLGRAAEGADEEVAAVIGKYGSTLLSGYLQLRPELQTAAHRAMGLAVDIMLELQGGPT